MLQMVNTVELHPERLARFRAGVAELADRAADTDEDWHWTAHETRFGDAARMYFVTEAESYEQIERLGSVEKLWTRVFGESDGRKRFLDASECIVANRHEISMPRPDLSYVTGETSRALPFALVTGGKARPGGAEALEELFRKVAEAIPKVDDPARMLTFQTAVGELGTYYAVRPLERLSDLDRQAPTPQLLDQAFGSAEGGLVWRAGMEAIQEARREIVAYVPELANPRG